MSEHVAIDEVLGHLPAGHVRGRCGLARLVLGCNGGFVVVPAGSEPEPAARLARRLVDETRATIADHLSLVPFLDALVVERSPRQLPGVPAVLVALDLLPDLLVQGPPVVPVDVVAGVRRLLTGQLLGAWRVDAAQPADTIVLCDPTQATTSPT